jgi:cytochrome c2
MPRFNFSQEQKKALVCFLLAQRKSGAQASIRVPATSGDSAMVRGEGLIYSKRCGGCHVTYPFGEARGGAIRAFISDSVMVPPFLYLEGKKVREEWLFSFLDSVTMVRPWLNVRMPAFHFPADTLGLLIRHFAAEAGPPGPEAYFDPDRVSKSRLKLGEKLFKDFKCVTCHVSQGKLPRRPRDQWAPDIALIKKRMRVEWCGLWLKNPQKYVPGTKMPSYFFDYDEVEKVYTPLIPDAENSLIAMRDYLFAP